MRISWIATVLLSTLVGAAAMGSQQIWTVQADQGDAVEPPMLLELEIDGERAEIELGVPKSVTVNGESVRVTLLAKKYRVFDRAGISFSYSRCYSFDAEIEDELRIWMLDGKDTVIHVQSYRDLIDPDDVVQTVLEGIKAELDQSSVKNVECSAEFGSETKSGTRCVFSIGSIRIEFSAYGFKVDDDVVVILLQDTLDDDGQNTPEAIEALSYFKNSFELTED